MSRHCDAQGEAIPSGAEAGFLELLLRRAELADMTLEEEEEVAGAIGLAPVVVLMEGGILLATTPLPLGICCCCCCCVGVFIICICCC